MHRSGAPAPKDGHSAASTGRRVVDWRAEVAAAEAATATAGPVSSTATRASSTSAAASTMTGGGLGEPSTAIATDVTNRSFFSGSASTTVTVPVGTNSYGSATPTAVDNGSQPNSKESSATVILPTTNSTINTGTGTATTTASSSSVGMLRDFPSASPAASSRQQTQGGGGGVMLRDFGSSSQPQQSDGTNNNPPSSSSAASATGGGNAGVGGSGSGFTGFTEEQARAARQHPTTGPPADGRPTWRTRAKAQGDIGECLYGRGGTAAAGTVGGEEATSAGTVGGLRFANNQASSSASSQQHPIVTPSSSAEDGVAAPSSPPNRDDHRGGSGPGHENVRLAPKFQLGRSEIGSLSTPERRKQRSGGGGDDAPSSPDSHSSSPPHGPRPVPSHVIDVQALRRIASQGISDVGSHRAVAWRVLLGYVPPDTEQWESVLSRDRGLYRNLVGELFVRNHKDDASPRCHRRKKKQQQQREEKDGEEGGGSNEEEQESAGSGSTTTGSGEAGAGGLIDKGDGEGSGEATDSLNAAAPADSSNDATAASDGDDGTGKMQGCREARPDASSSPAAYSDSRVDDGGGPNPPPAPLIPPAVSSPPNAEDLLASLEQSCGDTRSRWKPPTPSPAAPKSRKELESRGAPVPTPHVPTSQDGYAALVPARIREQWKADGKDLAVMDDHCKHIHRRRSSLSGGAGDGNSDDYNGSGGTGERQSDDDDEPTNPVARAMNALLVVDDEGYVPGPGEGGDDDVGRRPSKRIVINDDPLHRKNSEEEEEDDTKWHQFFENAALLDEIRKDVVRTHPDLHFFLEPEDNLGQRRYAALERILFVWAKLNKGVRYVQGMNEIVGTIYFVLANDFNEEWAAEAEADAYFLFNILMVEMRDVFVPDLDEADTGIQGRISNMMSLLSLHDPEVRCHLNDCGIDASFYSIRWLTTLLSREFCLPDTIRLWDSMFASTHKDNFLRYVCVTMVMMIRDQLLAGDFSTCLRLLQAYPPTNVDRMLESSRALWIYESQITLACHKAGIGLGDALASIPPPPGIIMAYGLPGGVAEDRMARARQAGERGLAVAKGAAKEAAREGRSLLGSAARAWNNWEKSRTSPKSSSRRKQASNFRSVQSMPY